MVTSMVSEHSASGFDGEMESRGLDLEDKSCITVSITLFSRLETQEPENVRLGNRVGKGSGNGSRRTKRVTIE